MKLILSYILPAIFNAITTVKLLMPYVSFIFSFVPRLLISWFTGDIFVHCIGNTESINSDQRSEDSKDNSDQTSEDSKDNSDQTSENPNPNPNLTPASIEVTQDDVVTVIASPASENPVGTVVHTGRKILAKSWSGHLIEKKEEHGGYFGALSAVHQGDADGNVTPGIDMDGGVQNHLSNYNSSTSTTGIPSTSSNSSTSTTGTPSTSSNSSTPTTGTPPTSSNSGPFFIPSVSDTHDVNTNFKKETIVPIGKIMEQARLYNKTISVMHLAATGTIYNLFFMGLFSLLPYVARQVEGKGPLFLHTGLIWLIKARPYILLFLSVLFFKNIGVIYAGLDFILNFPFPELPK